MRLGPLALGIIAGLCAGTSATAQSAPTIGTKREKHFGVAVTGVHDSNFTGGQTDNPTLEKRGEYTLRPSANFSVTQPIGRHAVFVDGSAGYDFHKHNPNLDSRRIDVSGGGALRASRCTATLVGNYASRRSELLDATLVSVQNQRTSVSEAVTLGCGVSRGAGFLVSAQNQEVRNSVQRQKFVDVNAKNAALALTYGRPTLGTFGVSFAYADSDLFNAINALGGVGDGFSVESVSGTYQRVVGKRLNLNLAAGMAKIKRDTVPVGSDRTVDTSTYNGSLTYRLNPRIDFTLSGGRRILPSEQAGKLYDVTKNAALSGNYRIGTRFVVGAGASVAKTRSNRDTKLVGVAVTNSRNETMFASLSYRQSRRASLSFDVRRVDRNTDVDILDYTDTRVSVTTAVNF